MVLYIARGIGPQKVLACNVSAASIGFVATSFYGFVGLID